MRLQGRSMAAAKARKKVEPEPRARPRVASGSGDELGAAEVARRVADGLKRFRKARGLVARRPGQQERREPRSALADRGHAHEPDAVGAVEGRGRPGCAISRAARHVRRRRRQSAACGRHAAAQERRRAHGKPSALAGRVFARPRRSTSCASCPRPSTAANLTGEARWRPWWS